MRTILTSGTMVLLMAASPAMADAATKTQPESSGTVNSTNEAAKSVNPGLKALQSSKYDFMTDGLDMQGGGTTWVEMMADKVIERVQQIWESRKDVLTGLDKALKDPMFRSAVDELVRQVPTAYLTTPNLIKVNAQNPVVAASFYDYGALNTTEEQALALESSKLGYFEVVVDWSPDQKTAVLHLWRKASSPLEEQLKYSASYRYGMD